MDLGKLTNEMLSEDKQVRKAAISELVGAQDQKVVDALIPLLESEDSWIRNSASIVLHDYSNDMIVKPLLKAILKKENRGANGTMVWALENKDVSPDVLDLFKILISHQYEAQIMVLPVIRDGDFTIDRSLRKRIVDYIEKHKESVDRRAVNTARMLLKKKCA